MGSIGAWATEEDLVDAALEETMVNAYHEIRRESKALGEGTDLRTAALVIAIHKVARSYMQLGIFPVVHATVESEL